MSHIVGTEDIDSKELYDVKRMLLSWKDPPLAISCRSKTASRTEDLGCPSGLATGVNWPSFRRDPPDHTPVVTHPETLREPNLFHLYPSAASPSYSLVREVVGRRILGINWTMTSGCVQEVRFLGCRTSTAQIEKVIGGKGIQEHWNATEYEERQGAGLIYLTAKYTSSTLAERNSRSKLPASVYQQMIRNHGHYTRTAVDC
jgi:hypothetical protein